MPKEFKLSHPLFDLSKPIFYNLYQNLQFRLDSIIKLIKLSNIDLSVIFNDLEKYYRRYTFELFNNKSQFSDNLADLTDFIFISLVYSDYFLSYKLYSTGVDINTETFSKLSIRSEEKQISDLNFVILVLLNELLDIIERINYKDSFNELFTIIKNNMNNNLDIINNNFNNIITDIVNYNSNNLNNLNPPYKRYYNIFNDTYVKNLPYYDHDFERMFNHNIVQGHYLISKIFVKNSKINMENLLINIY